MPDDHRASQTPEHPPRPAIKPWQKRDATTHADCRVFSVLKGAFQHPGRRRKREFFYLNSPDWVNVVALTRNRKIVLINQYRFGVADFSLEIPGGLIDPEEDPVKAGLRELVEETGFVSTNARLLGSVRPNPAIMNNTCHFILAEEAVPSGRLAWDLDEEIEVVLTSPDTALSWARNGTINHALVLNAFFLFEPIWQSMNASRPLT